MHIGLGISHPVLLHLDEVLLLKQVMDAENRCLIRDPIADQFDADEMPHGGYLNQINKCLPWNDCFPLGNCQEFLTVCPRLAVFCLSSANPSGFPPITSAFMCVQACNSGYQVDCFLVAQPYLGAFAKHYTFERVFCCLICLSAGLITD